MPSPTRRAPRSRRALAVGAAALAAAVLAACGADPEEPAAAAPSAPASAAGDTAEDAPAPSSSSPSATSSSPAQPPLPSGVPGEPVEVATGLPLPWDLAFLPDGSGALVSLRDEARVVRVGLDGSVADVPATGEDGRVPGVVPGGEGGLLGLALRPGPDGDELYAYTTAEDDNRVVRMPFDGRALGDPVPVVTGIPKAGNHNGGRIRFGPDGALYVATGDAADRSTPPDASSLGGKVLRVTPDGAPAPGNPDPASPVWTSGHRNVQGMAWDTAGRLFASEFGQDTFDELNLLRAGGDYGWPEVEGSGGAPTFVDPLRTWATREASPSGVAVTADAVYLAALRGQRLWRVPLAADGSVGEPDAFLEGDLGRLRAVEVGPDGALWVLTSNTGRDLAREGDDRLVRVPLG